MSSIVWAGAGEGTVRLTRPSGLGARLAARCARSFVARELVRLTPADPAVALWKATCATVPVQALMADADLIVAAERDASYAAWRWNRLLARRGRDVAAVYGFPAASVVVQERRR